ncbi:MAG: (d)CMP kinase [Chlamydiota bacterium]|nr:(d)CMP kinase [Chlamydiota bacterium]
MIITIDGPVATGKSTIAKKLAHEIGFIYLNTGAMYRGLTYGLLKDNIDLDDTEAIQSFLKNFTFDIKVKNGERRYFVGKDDATDAISSTSVTSNVSKVSALDFVRKQLVTLQREVSEGVNAVVEGRDMGTVVFPNAELKIFLTGNTEVRARRRYNELKKKYPEEFANLTLEETIKSIDERDHYDTTREISPLRQAEDAYIVDTSHLSIDEVVSQILEYKEKTLD